MYQSRRGAPRTAWIAFVLSCAFTSAAQNSRHTGDGSRERRASRRWLTSLVRAMCAVAVLLTFSAAPGTASAVTINVSNGGGTLSYTNYGYDIHCGPGDNPHSEANYIEYTNFSFSGGTVTNPGVVATYNSAAKTSCGIYSGYNPATLTLTMGNNCTITFAVAAQTATLSSPLCNGTAGYVNPKFMVVGVTYAPPGPSANTFVSYSHSTLVGTTKSLSGSFADNESFSVIFGFGVSFPMVAKGNITQTTTNETTQTTKTSSAVTTSIQVQSGYQTGGTSNYSTPVNHDDDLIWVWLNPAVIFNVAPGYVTWEGYGYDGTDEGGMDIVPIALGYLNGDFGAIPPDLQNSLNRAWASDQVFPAGQSAALNSNDLAQIAAADPFSVSTYGPTYIGYTPPATETLDHRFTSAECASSPGTTSGNSPFVSYVQANPSQVALIDTCTLTYVNSSTQAQETTNVTSQTFSVDASVSNQFFVTFSAELKSSSTLTWTNDAQSSITSTATSTGSLEVQGPPCNNAVANQGPCLPVYDADGTQPVQFQVFQDNVYGTFMFAPVHYY